MELTRAFSFSSPHSRTQRSVADYVGQDDDGGECDGFKEEEQIRGHREKLLSHAFGSVQGVPQQVSCAVLSLEFCSPESQET